MGGKSKSKSKSTQESSSTPLDPLQVRGYFDEINNLTKGGSSSSGRLFDWAQYGTPDTTYAAPTDSQIQSLGGLGATRKAEIDRARADAMSQIGSDPTLSVFQAQRARQLANREAGANTDAVAKETEAAILDAAMARADKSFAAGEANAKKRREDLMALAEIFFGGKGQKSTSTGTSTSKSSSFNLDSPVSFKFGG